jgi:hypothetical protein
MKKDIFKEFDGYDRIVEEREFSRKYGLDYSGEKDAAEPYINRLHPRRLNLRVSDIITETPSTKTFRLVSGTTICRLSWQASISLFSWRSAGSGPPGLTASPPPPTRPVTMTLPSGGWKGGWYPIIFSMK